MIPLGLTSLLKYNHLLLSLRPHIQWSCFISSCHVCKVKYTNPSHGYNAQPLLLMTKDITWEKIGHYCVHLWLISPTEGSSGHALVVWLVQLKISLVPCNLVLFIESDISVDATLPRRVVLCLHFSCVRVDLKAFQWSFEYLHEVLFFCLPCMPFCLIIFSSSPPTNYYIRNVNFYLLAHFFLVVIDLQYFKQNVNSIKGPAKDMASSSRSNEL